MDPIYLVTTVHIGDPVCQNDFLVLKRKRRVGWYPTFEEAVRAVTSNVCDIYEMGHYDHCFIEEVEPGVYPICEHIWFFKWEGDFETGRYLPVDRPEGLESIVNFGIG
jgi:hypothetical protein